MWLVSCFGFNGPLRQSFSLYRAVFQRGRKKRENIDERKKSKQPPPASTASAIGPFSTILSKISFKLLNIITRLYGHYSMGYFYLNLFLGSELNLLTLNKRYVGQGYHGSPSKNFCVNATAVNHKDDRMAMLSLIVLN